MTDLTYHKRIIGQTIASTLIHGVRDAVLVDAFLMVNQAKALADWVPARGKNLTTIYIGVGTLLERLARAVATRNAIRKMHQQASPQAERHQTNRRERPTEYLCRTPISEEYLDCPKIPCGKATPAPISQSCALGPRLGQYSLLRTARRP